MSKLEKVRADITSNYDYVRFSICDIHGSCRGVVQPSRNAVKYLEKGVNMYQGLLLLGALHENIDIPDSHKLLYNVGNMAIVPDLDTLRPIPWGGGGKFKVAELLCESCWKTDDSPQEACPRYVAREQLRKLDDLGFRLYSAFEFEYFLFQNDTMKPLFVGRDYMSHRIQNKFSSLMFQIDQQFKQSGVDIETMHTEYAPGEFEVAMKPKYGIDSADAALNFKQGITEMSDTMNITASFMSKMDLEETGAGVHFNHSLLSKDDGKYVLYDANAPDKLSGIAKHWIAGIIKHTKALVALTSPTVNCYRRLHQFMAPTAVFWGIEDREASLRVKNHGPPDTYFENRLPSGLCNPYIVLAATVAAGLDGIINKLECPPPGTLKDSEPLPKTFEEALEALEADSEMKQSLGQEFVTWYICNRRFEIQQFDKVTNEAERLALERERYLES